MSAFRASAPLLTGFALAASLALTAFSAPLAQGTAAEGSGTGPIPLFPPTVRPAAPAGEATPGAPGAGTGGVPQWPSEGDVEVNQLGAPDADSLGVLDREHGGFGVDAWAGSDRATIEALLRALPGDLASPTLHRLAVRLLLSSARAPVADKSASGDDFLRLRAERLYALGGLDGLNRLLALVPQGAESGWLVEARVDGLLLAGRDAEACAEAPAALARAPQSLYWAKVQVFCQLVAGETDPAMLGLDLLREQAPESDPAFFSLADALAAGRGGNAEAAALSPLTLAMLRRSGGTLASEAVASAEPALLHGIAGLAGDPAVQAAAVERLVQIGALPGERLAAAYGAFEFTDAELADPLATAEAAGDVRGRALLYRAASRETLAATRAELVRAAFLSAEADGRAAALARAMVPLMQELAPTAELAWFAPLAARTLYRAGQFERAGAWLSVLRLDGRDHPESREAYAALRPLQRLAGGPEPLAPETLSGERGLLLFVLSRALGQAEEAAPVEGGAARPLERLPRLLALGDAAAAGRRGETVLLAITALESAPPAETHPLALGYVVAALRAVGLGGEARALAIEAALGADA